MRVALAQINPTVGDIEGNTARILASVDAARRARADLLVTPELAVFGYPPKDLLRRGALVARNVRALDEIAARCTDLAAVIGFVQPDPTGAGNGVLNAAAFCRGGKVVTTYAKVLLPTYDIFDEVRYFNAGRDVGLVEHSDAGKPVRIGLTICEDLWNDEQFEGRRVYGDDPIKRTVKAGADVLINLSASPYRAGIHERRERLFTRQVRAHQVPLIFVNQVGGNDDLVFDGASLVLDGSGSVAARAPAFMDGLIIAEVRSGGCEGPPASLR